MRNLMILVLIFLTLPSSIVLAKKNWDNTVSVEGYWRNNGTYVQPYLRTLPDKYRWNNFGHYNYYDYYNYKTLPRFRDYDRDGIPNCYDLDDDNDGILDDYEKRFRK